MSGLGDGETSTEVQQKYNRSTTEVQQKYNRK